MYFYLHTSVFTYTFASDVKKEFELVGKISRPQLDRAPIESVESFPKLGNQGVLFDMATLISKTGHFYGSCN